MEFLFCITKIDKNSLKILDVDVQLLNVFLFSYFMISFLGDHVKIEGSIYTTCNL